MVSIIDNDGINPYPNEIDTKRTYVGVSPAFQTHPHNSFLLISSFVLNFRNIVTKVKHGLQNRNPLKESPDSWLARGRWEVHSRQENVAILASKQGKWSTHTHKIHRTLHLFFISFTMFYLCGPGQENRMAGRCTRRIIVTNSGEISHHHNWSLTVEWQQFSQTSDRAHILFLSTYYFILSHVILI